MAVEDQGAGAQHVRFRSWPRCSRGVATLALLFASLAALAGVDGAWAAAAVLASTSGFLVVRTVVDCGLATTVTLEALGSVRPRQDA